MSGTAPERVTTYAGFEQAFKEWLQWTVFIDFSSLYVMMSLFSAADRWTNNTGKRKAPMDLVTANICDMQMMVYKAVYRLCTGPSGPREFGLETERF